MHHAREDHERCGETNLRVGVVVFAAKLDLGILLVLHVDCNHCLLPCGVDFDMFLEFVFGFEHLAAGVNQKAKERFHEGFS